MAARPQPAAGLREQSDANWRGRVELRHDQRVFPARDVAQPGAGPRPRLSWLAALPPFLEQKTPDAQKLRSLCEQIDPKLGWNAGPNAPAAHAVAPLFLCPARPIEDPHVAPGRTNYVGIAGVGRNAAELSLDAPLAGAFGYDRTVRSKPDLTAGASKTLLTAETAHDNGPWTAGGPPTVRGLDPADVPYIGPGRAFGGMHPGGQNVLFADGSAEFMDADVSPRVFETIACLRRDAEAPAP